MYNNLEAVNEENLSILCNFFVELMKIVGLKHEDLAPGVHNIVANLNGHDPFANMESKQRELLTSVIRKTIKKMKIVLVAPATYYQLKPENLYDYELPPGLITINEAMVVIEVYRRGGKLVANSVHKLLRLGYKILSQRPNVCEVNVTEQERLIVVGDIHGKRCDHAPDGLLSSNGFRTQQNSNEQDNWRIYCTSWTRTECPGTTPSTSSTVISWIGESTVWNVCSFCFRY
jgi:hypothetical protein